jgi:hypothetical protein
MDGCRFVTVRGRPAAMSAADLTDPFMLATHFEPKWALIARMAEVLVEPRLQQEFPAR